MVYYRHAPLDTTFAALSDPTRRAILARLAEQDGMSVSEIAKPFPVSLPAVMKHLDVLADAKLIRRSKKGRVVSCELTAPMCRSPPRGRSPATILAAGLTGAPCGHPPLWLATMPPAPCLRPACSCLACVSGARPGTRWLP